MQLTRRNLIVAAASFAATAAPAVAAVRATDSVLSSVRIYSIRTRKSEQDLASIIRHISGAKVAEGGIVSAFGGVIDKHAPLAMKGSDHLLSWLGDMKEVKTALLEGALGERTPLFVGQKTPYVSKVESATDADGKRTERKTYAEVETGIKLAVMPEIRANGSVYLEIFHQFADIDGIVDADAGGTLIQLPRVRQTASAFAANLKPGQSVICLQKADNSDVDPAGERTFVATIITPEVVRA